MADIVDTAMSMDAAPEDTGKVYTSRTPEYQHT